MHALVSAGVDSGWTSTGEPLAWTPHRRWASPLPPEHSEPVAVALLRAAVSQGLRLPRATWRPGVVRYACASGTDTLRHAHRGAKHEQALICFHLMYWLCSNLQVSQIVVVSLQRHPHATPQPESASPPTLPTKIRRVESAEHKL